jgi:hypothetical protein
VGSLHAKAILASLVLAFSCARSANTSMDVARPPDSPSPSQEALLDKLWSELRSVRAAASGSTPYQAREPLPDVTLLVGMARHQILSALDPSQDCEPGSHECDDIAVLRFWWLPRNSFGGGPELHLTFEHDGTCASARWWHSQ